jgi:hypothetical protein
VRPDDAPPYAVIFIAPEGKGAVTFQFAFAVSSGFSACSSFRSAMSASSRYRLAAFPFAALLSHPTGVRSGLRVCLGAIHISSAGRFFLPITSLDVLTFCCRVCQVVPEVCFRQTLSRVEGLTGVSKSGSEVLVPGGGLEPPQSFRTCGF